MTSKTLFADKPLKDPGLDSFNYAPFASTLAESICKMIPPDGLVMALYGPWGSGKSTIVEFILKYLRDKSEQERPIVIRFNPWWFTGQENLTRHFFEQLSEEFGSTTETVLNNIVSSIRHLSDVVAEVPLPGAGVPKALADKMPNLNNRKVTELKERISNALQKSKHRVLIVMDDIDRLDAEEIRQLFRLIKAVADFPNVVYLLAFDKAVVTQSLSNTYGISGDRFLDKIVQVPFEIPSISDSELRNLFLKGVEGLIGSVPMRLFKDEISEPIGYLFYMQPLLRTPRDVLRLLNTLTVTYAAVKDIVDPADFIAIEALRMFRIDVYNTIWSNKTSLTQEPIEAVGELIVNELFSDNAPHIHNLLRGLFPILNTETLLGQKTLGYHARLRVCSAAAFDTYFRFSVSAPNKRNHNMIDLLNLARESKPLKEIFYNSSELELFLNRLPDHLEELKNFEIAIFISNFLNFGDKFIKLNHTLEEPSIKQLLVDLPRIIVDLLGKLPLEQRFPFLTKAVSNQNFSILALKVIYLIGLRNGKYGKKIYGNKILHDEDVPELDTLAFIKIKLVVDAAVSFKSEDLHYAFDIWGKTNINKERHDWVRDKTWTPSEILDFVDGYTNYSTASWTNLYVFFGKPELNDVLNSYIQQPDSDSNLLARIKKLIPMAKQAGETYQ